MGEVFPVGLGFLVSVEGLGGGGGLSKLFAEPEDLVRTMGISGVHEPLEKWLLSVGTLLASTGIVRCSGGVC